MRTHVIVGAVGLLVGLGVGARASSQALVLGTLRAQSHEIEEGYFQVGEQSFLVLKPGSPAHTWASQQVGQRITITLSSNGEPDGIR